jgi:phosphopantetheine adenylyltransferase
MTSDHHALTSSSLIRQIDALGGDVRKLTGLLPKIVIKRLLEKQKSSPGLATAISDVPIT